MPHTKVAVGYECWTCYALTKHAVNCYLIGLSASRFDCCMVHGFMGKIKWFTLPIFSFYYNLHIQNWPQHSLKYFNLPLVWSRLLIQASFGKLTMENTLNTEKRNILLDTIYCYWHKIKIKTSGDQYGLAVLLTEAQNYCRNRIWFWYLKNIQFVVDTESF